MCSVKREVGLEADPRERKFKNCCIKEALHLTVTHMMR